MSEEREEYKFDHFKNIDEVMHYFNYWYKEEDVYSINRYLSLKDFNYISNKYQELQQENQELKEKLDKYENPEDMTLMIMWCTEKVKDENEKLMKQLEETDRKLFLTKNELDMREKSIDNKLNQQKEFIKYLEDESKEIYRDGGLRQNIYKEILQKYKSIIGE